MVSTFFHLWSNPERQWSDRRWHKWFLAPASDEVGEELGGGVSVVGAVEVASIADIHVCSDPVVVVVIV